MIVIRLTILFTGTTGDYFINDGSAVVTNGT